MSAVVDIMFIILYDSLFIKNTKMTDQMHLLGGNALVYGDIHSARGSAFTESEVGRCSWSHRSGDIFETLCKWDVVSLFFSSLKHGKSVEVLDVFPKYWLGMIELT